MELIAKYSLIGFIIISTFGLVGNILSGMVLSRKEMKSSTSFLLLGLTLFDGFLLITYLLYFGIVLTVLYFPDVDYTFVIPDLLLPINKTAYTGSIYTTVLVTLDRYFAVCWPLHARIYLTMKKSKLSMFGVLVFSILINLPRWLEYVVPISDPDNLIYPEQLLVFSDRYVLYYHAWIWTIAMYAIPILIIGVLNFCIWKEVRKANNTSREIGTSGRPENSLTKMLLTLVTVFFILNILNCIVSFSLRYFLIIEPFELEVLACFPLILNSSLNFIIYCALGQHFRNQFFKMTSFWCSSFCSSRTRGHRTRTDTISCASVYYTQAKPTSITQTHTPSPSPNQPNSNSNCNS